jgi:hypothetical protein
MVYLRALMSFDEADIKRATKILERAEAIANAQVDSYSSPITLESVAALPFNAIGSFMRFTGIASPLQETRM